MHQPFSRVSGQIVARARAGPGAAVRRGTHRRRTRGQDWWSLGFDATGPAGLLGSELQATFALVFAHSLPAGLKSGPDKSRYYAQWLRQRPGANSDADP